MSMPSTTSPRTASAIVSLPGPQPMSSVVPPAQVEERLVGLVGLSRPGIDGQLHRRVLQPDHVTVGAP